VVGSVVVHQVPHGPVLDPEPAAGLRYPHPAVTRCVMVFGDRTEQGGTFLLRRTRLGRRA
jgi:hypothetical protein